MQTCAVNFNEIFCLKLLAIATGQKVDTEDNFPPMMNGQRLNHILEKINLCERKCKSKSNILAANKVINPFSKYINILNNLHRFSS